MKTYRVEYINYEGNTSSTLIEVKDHESESDAEYKVIIEDFGWGDGIHKIINTTEEFL